MISGEELRCWRDRFGVDEQQIRHDHLISHVLAAFAELELDAIFRGGTALARSHLDGLRISEDIDLLTRAPAEIAKFLSQELPGQLRREFPNLELLDGGRWVQLLRTSGLTLQVQAEALEPAQVRCHEFEWTTVNLRYSDLDRRGAGLRLPSAASFVAMKHLAYSDRVARNAPRDLVDLAAMAEAGMITRRADEIVRCLRGFGVQPSELAEVPQTIRRGWTVSLGHQMRAVPDVDQALTRVREAWASALAW